MGCNGQNFCTCPAGRKKCNGGSDNRCFQNPPNPDGTRDDPTVCPDPIENCRDCTEGGTCKPKRCLNAGDCKECVGGTTPGLVCVVDSDCSGGGTCDPTGEACVLQGPPVTLGYVSAPTTPCGYPMCTVESTPTYRQWPEPVIHVTDCEIAPVHSYLVSSTPDGVSFSTPLELGTIDKPTGGRYWADTVGQFFFLCASDGVTVCVTDADCPPGDTCGYWTPAQGLLNVDDVLAWIKYVTFKPAPHTSVVDIATDVPSCLVQADDLQAVLKAFLGNHYPPPWSSSQVCVGGADDGLPCNQTDPTDCPGGKCVGCDVTTCP